MNYNYLDSPVGLLEFSFSEGKLYSLKRVDKMSKPISDNAFSESVKAQLLEYFSGKRQCFNLAYALKGTPFQEQVWAELLKIPYGQTRSYKGIAIALLKPNASRAVGLANGKNPLMILVPCHRVISSNGSLNGYACGCDMKQKLLMLEGNAKF